MADKNSTVFLGAWSRRARKLIEISSGEKITPEFYIGSEFEPQDIFINDILGDGIGKVIVKYTGDGELSAIGDSISTFSFGRAGDNNKYLVIVCQLPLDESSDDRGNVTVSSTETDNYKAGNWTFPYYLAYE